MPAGRPSKYKPEYAKEAEKLCRLGATDDELADFWGVDRATVYRWKLVHEEFCNALKIGKDHADHRVERSLYQKATGYDYEEQVAFKVKVGQYEEKVEVETVLKHAPADTTAQIFWLKNRRRDDWRDKQDHAIDLSGEVKTDSDPRALAKAVAALLSKGLNGKS